MKKRDLLGKKFGRLTVTAPAQSRIIGARKRAYWECLCDCGKKLEVGSEPLVGGMTRSCGCLRTEVVRARCITHGHQVGYKCSRELKSWHHAKSRCYTLKDPKYPIYGARGITMCAEWRSNFQVFFDYMGVAPAGMTLDRINTNGNYEPGNCRWATPKTQANNTRKNVIVTVFGETMTLKAAAEKHGVDYKTLHARVKYKGQSAEAAIKALQ